MDQSSGIVRGLLVAGLVFLTGGSRLWADDIQRAVDRYDSGDKTIQVERFEPKGKGKLPTILVLHGADGFEVNDGKHYFDIARDLAAHGYIALVIHYFDRTDTRTGDPSTYVTNWRAWMKAVQDGIEYAGRQPNVDRRRIGIVGIALGGFLGVSMAVIDARIQAVVEYFGGMPGPMASQVRNMPPVLILHGDADKLTPVEEAYKLEKLLKEKGMPYEIKIYPGQGRPFTGEDARDANRRMFEFLDKHVKTEK